MRRETGQHRVLLGSGFAFHDIDCEMHSASSAGDHAQFGGRRKATPAATGEAGELNLFEHVRSKTSGVLGARHVELAMDAVVLVEGEAAPAFGPLEESEFTHRGRRFVEATGRPPDAGGFGEGTLR